MGRLQQGLELARLAALDEEAMQRISSRRAM